MGGCLYRKSEEQYKYDCDDIMLKQQHIRERIAALNKLQDEKEQMQQRYQKNIEDGEKMRPPKKLNQSSIEQSGYDVSLSKNLQNLEYIEEAEDESSILEKGIAAEKKIGDDEFIDDDGLLLQLALTDKVVANNVDNIRDQLQGRDSTEMDDDLLQYFNTTRAKQQQQQ